VLWCEKELIGPDHIDLSYHMRIDRRLMDPLCCDYPDSHWEIIW